MNAANDTMVTMNHPRLAAAVKAAAVGVPRKTFKPILSNVKLSAADGGFHVYATDLETQVSVTVGDHERNPTGETLIPAVVAAAIGKAVKAAPGIAFCGLTVETLGMRAPAENVIEYPSATLPIDAGFAAMVPFGFLRLVDDHVSCATDEESSRYALGGVLFERVGTDETLRAVGTDGRRLHVASVPSGGSGDYPDRLTLSAILSPRAIRLFRKAVETMAAACAGKSGKAAAAYADGGRVGVKSSPLPDGGTLVELSWCGGSTTVRVSARAVEGRFPRWRDCFPDSAGPNGETMPCYLPMPETVAQVKAAGGMSSEFSKGVALSGGRLSAQSADRGTYDAPFVGDVPDGTRTKLDPRYWIEAAEGAAAAEGGRVVRMYVARIGVIGGAATFIGGAGLHPAGQTAVGFAAVVMPLAAD